MLRLEELKDEGRHFLDGSHYEELDDMAKMNASAYMRGLIDGRKLKEAESSGLRMPVKGLAV